jgi:hypothetical protein
MLGLMDVPVMCLVRLVMVLVVLRSQLPASLRSTWEGLPITTSEAHVRRLPLLTSTPCIIVERHCGCALQLTYV